MKDRSRHNTYPLSSKYVTTLKYKNITVTHWFENRGQKVDFPIDEKGTKTGMCSLKFIFLANRSRKVFAEQL